MSLLSAILFSALCAAPTYARSHGAAAPANATAKSSAKTTAKSATMAAVSSAKPAAATSGKTAAGPGAKGLARKASHFTLPPQALSGWAVRDAANDSLLTGNLSDKNFTPGSTQKLFTSWIALEILGGDKTFTTQLLRNGAIEGDRLKGDLVIKGAGDPAFASAQLGNEYTAETIFTDWLRALQNLGVRSVEGCVVGDGSYLDEDGPHPAELWEDAGNYYAGEAAGLCFNDNIFTATFSGAASAGKPVILQNTLPGHTGIAKFENRLLTASADSRDSAFIIGGFPSPVRLLRGTYPAGRIPFTLKGSLPNPAYTCAREFRDFLISHGIAFASPDGSKCGDSLALPNHAPMNAAVNAGAVAIASHVSPPLREIIRVTNQKSDNNYAAQLLAVLGKETGRPGNWRGGLEVLYAYLDQHGFDRAEIHFKDGNGLSRYNWVSPNQVTRLLTYAARQKNFADFQASLIGSPGSEGKLGRYGVGFENRLFAKTGTLEGVSALAGYLKAKSGRRLAFAIVINNFESHNGDAQKAFIPLLKTWEAKY